MNLRIFDYDIKFSSWGEIYLGLKQKWISPNDVFEICQAGRITPLNDDRVAKLYLSYEESLFKLFEILKEFIKEDQDPQIIKNEDELSDDYSYIPEQYWQIWKLEHLLRIKTNNSSTEGKLDEVNSLFHSFNFPDDWLTFISYQPSKDNVPIGIHKLYENMLNYIEKQINSLKNRQ
jgi:hypothetical protein